MRQWVLSVLGRQRNKGEIQPIHQQAARVGTLYGLESAQVLLHLYIGTPRILQYIHIYIPRRQLFKSSIIVCASHRHTAAVSIVFVLQERLQAGIHCIRKALNILLINNTRRKTEQFFTHTSAKASSRAPAKTRECRTSHPGPLPAPSKRTERDRPVASSIAIPVCLGSHPLSCGIAGLASTCLLCIPTRGASTTVSMGGGGRLEFSRSMHAKTTRKATRDASSAESRALDKSCAGSSPR